MPELSKASLGDQAYGTLLKRILSGGIQDGERLVIDRLAKEFGISLIPIREALARLHGQGLVEYASNQGYRVAPPPTDQDYEQLFRARLAIEYGALHMGFDRIDDGVISRLKDLNKQIAGIKSDRPGKFFDTFVKLIERFHIELVSLSGSPRLIQTYDKIGYGPQIGRRMYAKGVPDIKNNIREHSAIIAALRNGDEKAALKALEAHIWQGLKRFRSTLKPP